MGKSFLTKPKPKSDGSYWACRKCQKTPTANQDLYMQNIGTDEEKVWIACTDLECFIAQGGTKPEAGSASNFKKGKTPEEMFSYRKELSEKCFTYAKRVSSEDGTFSTPDEKRRLFLSIYEALMR